jgi:hypothetical protein
MIARPILILVLMILLARAVWRLIEGFVAGLSGNATPRVPDRGVQMVRDPICGTFLVPERAVVVTDGSRRVYFCSISCRDKYRARPSTRSGRRAPVEGRTA